MNGRKGMIAVFGAFAAPFILAAIVYSMGWFSAGVTNKGEFMPIELTLNWILPEQAADSQWIIFYPIPTNCDVTCTNVLYSLNQGFQALGKQQGDAHPVVVLNAAASMSKTQLKHDYGYIKVMPLLDNYQVTLQQLSSEFIYLVDPFGKVILRYPAAADKQQMILTTKDWITDLKRLLTYSRTS